MEDGAGRRCLTFKNHLFGNLGALQIGPLEDLKIKSLSAILVSVFLFGATAVRAEILKKTETDLGSFQLSAVTVLLSCDLAIL